MGVTDAPQWLPAAFVRSAAAVGATAGPGELEAHARDLLQRWAAPGRHHHGLRHLTFVLKMVDELAEETHHPDVVRLAAWYHGVVFPVAEEHAYRRAAGEDEVASAEVARTELVRLGVPSRLADRVADLVAHLRGHEVDRQDIDQLALADAHLAVLAQRPQDYRAYRRTVRAEYAHIPARHYLQARLAIVETLLGRRRIFGSPLAAAWEDAARENLSSERAILRAELDELGRSGPEGDLSTAEAAAGGPGPEPPVRRRVGTFHHAPVPPAAHAPASAVSPAAPSGPTPASGPLRVPGLTPDRDAADDARARRPAGRAPDPERDRSLPPTSTLEMGPDEILARPRTGGGPAAGIGARRVPAPPRAPVSRHTAEPDLPRTDGPAPGLEDGPEADREHAPEHGRRASPAESAVDPGGAAPAGRRTDVRSPTPADEDDLSSRSGMERGPDDGPGRRRR